MYDLFFPCSYAFLEAIEATSTFDLPLHQDRCLKRRRDILNGMISISRLEIAEMEVSTTKGTISSNTALKFHVEADSK